VKIVIKTTKVKLNEALEDFIEEKIGELEKFSKIFQQEYYGDFFGKGKPRAEAWVEIGKTTSHHQKGPIFFAECQMRLPGKSIRAEANNDDLRLAVTEVKDELQRQLKQYKNKKIVRRKKGQKKIKSLYGSEKENKK
jgi:ribosomal subunit interface protein